jgi:hypothetical protein
MLSQQKALCAVIFHSATGAACALAFHALQGLLEARLKHDRFQYSLGSMITQCLPSQQA